MLTPNIDKKLFLLDAYALIYRAYFAFAKNPRVNSKGQNTSAAFGFTNVLIDVIKNEKPTHLAVAFDLSRSSFRTDEYPEYKGTRGETPPEFNGQTELLVEALEAMGIVTLTKVNYEADDIIAYLSSTLPTKPEDRVFIVSSDKDYLQLISDKVIVYRPIEKEYYTTDTVKEKFNITPHNFLLYKLLMGDNSDGVTGIKGLGAKGLFKRFPELTTQDLSFDDLINLAETKLKEKVAETNGVMEKKEQAIDQLVKPLTESLRKMDEKIEGLEKTRVGAYSSLTEALTQMQNATKSLDKGTQSLVSALKNTGTRGKYGEIGLRRVVEFAGMSEHCDFEEQKHLDSDDGKLIPDMTINLPEGKNIVVDSKVPLDAYMKVFETEDEAQQKILMAQLPFLLNL